MSVQIGSAVYSSPGNGGSFGSLDAMVNYELAVSVRFNALISSFASTTVSARLRDRYRLVGQPSADPVPIRVRMPVSLGASAYVSTICDPGSSKVSLVFGGASDSLEYSNLACTIDQLFQPIELLTEGVPNAELEFEIRVDLAAAGSASAWASGEWEFLVPQGYSLVSCHGYGIPPVPVSGRSWGQLKAAYR